MERGEHAAGDAARYAVEVAQSRGDAHDGGAGLLSRVKAPLHVAEGDAQTLMKLIDTLEEDDDIQTVWGNYEISDAELEKLA